MKCNRESILKRFANHLTSAEE